jgi:hypothetical protein
MVADSAPESDAVDVVDGHENRRFVRHPELIKTTRRAHDGLGLDALDHTKTVIRVNDLVSDIECHVSPELVS